MAGILSTNLDKSEQLLALLNASLNPAVSNVALSSGVAVQDATGLPSTWYVPITGGASGTVKVEIGPTNAVANTIIPATAADAAASQVLSVRVPAGWWIKVTVSVATISANAQIVTG